MGMFDLNVIKRGATIHGPVATITAAMIAGVADRVGAEKWFNDENPGSPVTRSKRRTLCRLVKNASGINLKPGRLVRFKLGTSGCEVDGYTHAIGQGDYAVVDEFLPSAGVRANDLFWVVLRGPVLAITNTAGDATGSISQGSLVMAATAASSQNDTNAGRVSVFSVASPTDATVALQNANNQMNALGRAVSAMTSGQTDTNILIEADYHR